MPRFTIAFDIESEEYQETEDVAERIKEALNLEEISVTRTWDDSDDEHRLHSFADISHEITYRLDEDEDQLAFNSMRQEEIGDVDSLDYALEQNLIHCICGEHNMRKQEAVNHLKNSRDPD